MNAEEGIRNILLPGLSGKSLTISKGGGVEWKYISLRRMKFYLCVAMMFRLVEGGRKDE